VILYQGNQKLKLVFEKGGINLGLLGFTLSKKVSEVQLKPLSAGTCQPGELICISFNKMLIDSTVSADGFSCTVNGNQVNITSLAMSAANNFQIVLSLGQQLFYNDIIKLACSNGTIKATDGSTLENFNDLEVKNNLPVYLAIPGKIEAEAFSFNQGLKLETTSDVGGGQDVGFTDVGDYLDYRINVMKSANYNIEVRIACLNSAGIIQVQQINSTGQVINTANVNIPVTGGWQTWRSVNADISLTEGISKLRVKILKTEFNMNWYKFTEKGQGVADFREGGIHIFPNPVHDELNIELPGASNMKGSLLFRSLNGVLVKSVELTGASESQKISIGDIPKGFYILEIEISGARYRTKLIVQ
jgi:hypothetical protein